MAKLLCSTVYLRCDTAVLGTSLAPYTVGATAPLKAVAPLLPLLKIPFPQLPCRSQCELATSQCAELLSIPGSALPSLINCTGSSMIVTPTKTCSGLVNTGIPNYPNVSTTLAALTVAVSSILNEMPLSARGEETEVRVSLHTCLALYMHDSHKCFPWSMKTLTVSLALCLLCLCRILVFRGWLFLFKVLVILL